MNELRVHLATPEHERGAKWRHRFYDLLEVTRLVPREPRIFVGPDGFPYYALDVPVVGGNNPPMTLRSVLLPHPLGPIRQRSSPRLMSSEVRCSACTKRASPGSPN